MKCVCPMGGDRTCPDDCPLSVWAGLSAKDRKKQRKAVAEKLYKQGFTMEAIATQLGVTKMTISNDLKDFNCKEPLQSKPAKTATNPKGAGRPKGSKTSDESKTSGGKISEPEKNESKGGEDVSNKREPRPGRGRNDESELPTDVQLAMACAVLDEGKTFAQVVKQYEKYDLKSEFVPRAAVAREQGRREMLDKLLDAAASRNFTEKGVVKIEDAIRIHKAKLDKLFEQRVNEEVRRRIDTANDFAREENKRLRQENLSLQRVIGQRGVFTETEFRQMQILCHPDNSASEQLRAKLSQILAENQIRLVKSNGQTKVSA
jgi:hypothetical protein